MYKALSCLSRRCGGGGGSRVSSVNPTRADRLWGCKLAKPTSCGRPGARGVGWTAVRGNVSASIRLSSFCNSKDMLFSYIMKLKLTETLGHVISSIMERLCSFGGKNVFPCTIIFIGWCITLHISRYMSFVFSVYVLYWGGSAVLRSTRLQIYNTHKARARAGLHIHVGFEYTCLSSFIIIHDMYTCV